ncbi:MAG: hypothetical protein J7578_19305 [Chitinophagaceae bacterium]|nr:hypothetical protein [Chitinophagaceae bacterium]
MPYEQVFIGDIDASPVTLTDSKTIYPENRQGTLAKIIALPPGTSADGIFYFSVNGEYYERVIEGVYRACWANIIAGSDMTTLIQTVINDARVKTLLFDDPGGVSIIVNGTLSIPAGKVIAFANGNTLTGTGTVTVNGLVDAGPYKIFDGSLTVGSINAANTPLYPEWWGAVGNGTTDDSGAFNKLFQSCNKARGITISLRGVTYLINQEVTVPPLTAGTNIIRFEGNSTTLKTTSAITILKRMPANNATAKSDINNTTIQVDGIIFEGSSLAGQNALVIAATYNSVVSNCKFHSFDIGLDLQFCLNATVEQCNGHSNLTYSFTARTGTWSNVILGETQSNNTVFKQCRDYCNSGQTSGFYILNSDSVKLETCICEGANPITNIHFEVQTGVTTVQYFTVDNLHGENVPTGEHISIKGAAPFVRIISPFIQNNTNTYYPFLVTAKAAPNNGNGTIQIENLNYWAVNLKCKNEANSGTRWVFEVSPVLSQFKNETWFNEIFESTPPYVIPASGSRFVRGSDNYFSEISSEIQLNAKGSINFTGSGNFTNSKALYQNGSIIMGGNQFQLLQFAIPGQYIQFQGPQNPVINYAMFISNSVFKIRREGASIVDAIVIASSGKLGLNNANPAVGLDIGWTDALGLPAGTTAQRPTGAARYFRYNTETNTIEWYNGAAWVSPNIAGQEVSTNIRTVTANTTVGSSDSTLLVNSSAGNISITIDPVNAAKKIFYIKKISADPNTVTITPSSGTIDGAPSLAINTQWQTVQVQSNGTDLFIL